MRSALMFFAAFLALPLAARADCSLSGSMPEGSTCTVSVSCTLSSVETNAGVSCESCENTSSNEAACTDKFANSALSQYCSTQTATSTSWTEVWCAPPGDNTGLNNGPNNNCASATPSLLALAGLALLFRRRRAVRIG